MLLQGRSDLFAVSAGDTTHVAGTLAGLAAAGVQADLSLELRPDVSGYDLVHVFNLMRVDEAVIRADNARYRGRPVVVTPLYWNPAEALGVAAGRRWPGEQRLRRRVLQAADAVVVGAPGEADHLVRDLGPGPRLRVVPLGVSVPARLDPAPFRERFGAADYVLCVARITALKNQLGLIRALEGLRLPLVFVGPAHDREYLQACRRAAPPGTLFVGPLHGEALWSAYAGARVHVLASWYEYPGLASLEAAAAGCNVVSTVRGTARDYLGDDAWYCDPAEPESIRRAVAAAYRAERGGRLAERVRGYTWERAAARLRAVYEEVLSRCHGA